MSHLVMIGAIFQQESIQVVVINSWELETSVGIFLNKYRIALKLPYWLLFSPDDTLYGVIGTKK